MNQICTSRISINKNRKQLPMRHIEKARLNIFESDSVERKEREKAATASVLDRLNEDQNNSKFCLIPL